MRIYEQPLSEKYRLLMRFEQLLTAFEGVKECDSPARTRFAVENLIELQELTARVDLRAELLREFDRVSHTVDKMTSLDSIDQQRASELSTQLARHVNRLHTLKNASDHHLRTHELFVALKQKKIKTGGINRFDLPQFNYWLYQNSQERHALLEMWSQPYRRLFNSIELLLSLVRESGVWQPLIARQGFFEQSMEGNDQSLIRVRLQDDSHCYPEISSGRHRFSIRLMRVDDLARRAMQTRADEPFELMVSCL